MAKQPTSANAKAAQRKRTVKVEATGEAHISATFNNIIISLTNLSGQVISWSSAGKMGFRGSKKNTPYAAQMAAQDCSKVAHEAGGGRESAIRTIAASGIEVSEIMDITPIPHNGCRPPKRRRV
jgi:small subunit ribosomal protein S11